MNTATSNKLLDTSRFTKHPEGYKISGNYTPKRVPIPLDIQSYVTGSLPFDKRRQGEKPPKLDIYTQLVELGYQFTQSNLRGGRPYEFTEEELQVPDIRQDVIWLPEVELNVKISEILAVYNITRESAGLKRLRGVVPIICALLRRGVTVAPKIEMP